MAQAALASSENDLWAIKYSQLLGSPLNRQVWYQGDVPRPQLHGLNALICLRKKTNQLA